MIIGKKHIGNVANLEAIAFKLYTMKLLRLVCQLITFRHLSVLTKDNKTH